MKRAHNDGKANVTLNKKSKKEWLSPCCGKELWEVEFPTGFHTCSWCEICWKIKEIPPCSCIDVKESDDCEYHVMYPKEKVNPAHCCFECNKFIGHRGFCSKKCHDKWYDSVQWSVDGYD